MWRRDLCAPYRHDNLEGISWGAPRECLIHPYQDDRARRKGEDTDCEYREWHTQQVRQNARDHRADRVAGISP